MLQPSHIQVSHGPQHRQEQLQILQARGQELRGRNEDLEQQLAMMSSEAPGAIGKGWRSPRSINSENLGVILCTRCFDFDPSPHFFDGDL
jgi:hypothetical protein